MVQGTIRGLGDLYEDSVERMEIHISKVFDDQLPNRNSHRVPIRLLIEQNAYEGGIRSTERNDYIWICPDLKTHNGQRTNLGHVLPVLGFKNKDKVNLSVSGTEIRVSHSLEKEESPPIG